MAASPITAPIYATDADASPPGSLGIFPKDDGWYYVDETGTVVKIGDIGSVTGVSATSPIVSSGGTTPNISHADSGATPGTYPKVTVNAKGHVTAGDVLSDTDLPVVPISKGGTGETSAADAFDALSPADEKGALIVHNGTTNVKFPPGTDGQIIYYDSSTATGLRADDPPAGGGGGSAIIDITAGVDLDFLDFAYRNNGDNKYYKLDVTTDFNLDEIVCVTEAGGILTDAVGEGTFTGVIDGFSSLTIGAAIWASASVGGYTQTKPALSSGTTQAIIRLGFALTATSIVFVPNFVSVLSRTVLLPADTITITHGTDADSYNRRVRVLNYRSTLTGLSANIGTGGTPVFSSESGSAASFAFDGNTTSLPWWTGFGGGGAGVAYLGYDRGAGNEVSVRKLILTNADTGGYDASYASSSVYVQYSDNGSTWITVGTYSGLSTTAGASNTIYIPDCGDHRYWAVRTAVLVSSGFALAELQMFEATSETIQPMPVIAAEWDNAYSKIGCQYGDGSGANLSTQTSFINLTAIALDVLLEISID